MVKLVKYDPAKTYMYPNGGIATPVSIQKKFPAITMFTHVIETDLSEEILFSVENLSALRSLHEIDSKLSETAAIKAIEAIRNAPPPEPEVTPEERIAAALEFSNLLNM